MVAALPVAAVPAACKRELSSAWALRRSAASCPAFAVSVLRAASCASSAVFWSVTRLRVLSTWRPKLREVSSSVCAACSSRAFWSSAVVSGAGLGAAASAARDCFACASSVFKFADSCCNASSRARVVRFSSCRAPAVPRAAWATSALASALAVRRACSARRAVSSAVTSDKLAASASRSLRSRADAASSSAAGGAGRASAGVARGAAGAGVSLRGAGAGLAATSEAEPPLRAASRCWAASSVVRSRVATRVSRARPRVPFSRARDSHTNASIGSAATPRPSA